MRRSSQSVVMVLVLLSCLGITARSQAPVTLAEINGEWTGTLVLDNSSPRVALVFQLTDSTFAGKVYSGGGLLGEMQEGSRHGDTVHFKVDRLDFTGRIRGPVMAVSLIVYNGTTRTLTLTKTPPIPPPLSLGRGLIERLAQALGELGRVVDCPEVHEVDSRLLVDQMTVECRDVDAVLLERSNHRIHFLA
jgi:hypothetical protein